MKEFTKLVKRTSAIEAEERIGIKKLSCVAKSKRTKVKILEYRKFEKT